jgi:hypothetical protein
MPSLNFPALLCALACAVHCAPQPPGEDSTGTSTTGTSSSTSPTTSSTSPTDPTTSGTSTADATSTDPTTTNPTSETSETTETPTSTSETSSTTADTTTGALPCESGDLPGVCIRFLTTQTVYTLAEAQAGVVFDYEILVEAVQPMAGAESTCDQPDPSGLYTAGRVAGGDQSYCVCDVGICPCCDFPVITLAAGEYPGSFEWNGVNWTGPSDFGNPFGPPFPPGDYEVTLSADGVWSQNGEETPFALVGTLPITLVP